MKQILKTRRKISKKKIFYTGAVSEIACDLSLKNGTFPIHYGTFSTSD